MSSSYFLYTVGTARRTHPSYNTQTKHISSYISTWCISTQTHKLARISTASPITDTCVSYMEKAKYIFILIQKLCLCSPLTKQIIAYSICFIFATCAFWSCPNLLLRCVRMTACNQSFSKFNWNSFKNGLRFIFFLSERESFHNWINVYTDGAEVELNFSKKHSVRPFPSFYWNIVI